MELSFKPTHIKRYRDIARLVMKYARTDMLKDHELEALEEPEDGDGSVAHDGNEPRGEELAADLERMGPTFIKFGQLLASRAEMIPADYVSALERLQDDVEPFPFEDVERIVTEELGARISKAFAHFDEEPMAAASLGQAHRATLRDGRQVVVKVQRPHIRPRIAEDLESLHEVAALLDKRTSAGRKYEFRSLVDEFRKSLLDELDYRREASNLTTLADNLKSFEHIVVPRPVLDYSTDRVLTMDYVTGTKITDLSPVALLEAHGEVLAEELFNAYLQQIFVDGFFHADPHPGNVFLTSDYKIGLLDLGMAARISPRMQQQLLQLVLAVSEGRSDEAADFALKISEVREGFDERDFRRRIADVVARNQDVELGQMQVGKAFLELARNSGETGVRAPPELAMLGKALLQLDVIGRLLAPDFDPNAAVREQSMKIMNQRFIKSLSPANLFATSLEMKDLVDRLPARVNRLLDAAADNEIGFKVDTGIKPAELMVGLQKVANRITVGLVIAAMIVSAAMMMRVETDYTILGYPWLAMILFVMAAGSAAVLLFNTFIKDSPFSRKSRREIKGE